MFPTKFRPLARRRPCVSRTCRFPLVSSEPTLRRATRGFSMPRYARMSVAPMAAKLSSWEGRQSRLAPRSMIAVSGASAMNGPPRVGRSKPGKRPRASTLAAIVAPVEPMLTAASARPAVTRPTAPAMEAFGLRRSARTGCSPSATTPSEATTSIARPSVSAPASSRWTASGSPTSATRTLPSRAARTAPATGVAGASSPPMASSAMVYGPCCVMGSAAPWPRP